MKLHVIPDPFDKKTWFSEEVGNIAEFLTSYYEGKLPSNVKFYENFISMETEITLKNRDDVDYFMSLDCDIFVVQYPSADPLFIAAIVSAVLSVATTIYTFLAMPKMKGGAQQSPNNELQQRQNVARVGGRIPDIYGQVFSYPDLIAETYTIYNNEGVEVERSLLAIGRGYYQVNRVRDDTTDVEDIAGTSVSVYDPFTSIVGTPIYQSGRTFTDLPLDVRKSSAITGQTLDAPNDNLLLSTAIYFDVGGYIRSSSIDFTQYFADEESVMITGAQFGTKDYPHTGAITFKSDKTIQFTDLNVISDYENYQRINVGSALVEYSAGQFVDLAGDYAVSSITKTGDVYTVALQNAEGTNPNWQHITTDVTLNAAINLKDNTSSIILDETYSIDTVTSGAIKLQNPELINPDWDLLTAPTSSGEVEIALDKVNNKWVGWFTLFHDNADKAVFNLHFPNGLWRQNSKGGVSNDYTTIAIEWQYVDGDGDPIGSINRIDKRYDREQRASFGITETVDLDSINSGIRFRLCRTRKIIANNVQATCNIKSVFLGKDSTIDNYGNVTVIQSEAVANDGLYGMKARKLNALVTRKLRVDGEGAYIPTKSAAQAIIDMAIDEKIGRRSLSEVDVDQIVSEIDKVENYFSSVLATEFCYTFDDESLSFEESVGMVASACFSEAYRFGSKLRIRFEEPQNDSILLFNHTNKELRTEKRTFSFGIENDYDGITLEYTSPIDDARINYQIPTNGSAINPLEIKTSGIRNASQAMTRAWREWNKLRYKSIVCEFNALFESEILARNDRILVADNTNIKTQDGYVQDVEGLTLYVSQPVEFGDGDYFIHLQLASGKTDVILINKDSSSEYEITLTRAPLEPLITDEGMRVLTNYVVVNAEESAKTAFLVNTVDPATDNTNTIRCVNYDARYYEKDHDFF